MRGGRGNMSGKHWQTLDATSRKVFKLDRKRAVRSLGFAAQLGQHCRDCPHRWAPSLDKETSLDGSGGEQEVRRECVLMDQNMISEYKYDRVQSPWQNMWQS